MRALVIVTLLVLVAPARASDYRVTVPPGWTELPATTYAPMLAQMRAQEDTLSAEMTMYEAPDSSAKLAVTRSQARLGAPTRQNVQVFHDGTISGMKQAGATHVSDWSRFETPQRFVSVTVDEKDSLRTSQRALVVVDQAHVTHVLRLICMSAAGQPSAPCEQAMASMDMVVPNAIDIPDAADADTFKTSYRYGRYVGFALLGAIALGLLWRARTKSRR